jgi:periplasmic protein TonB
MSAPAVLEYRMSEGYPGASPNARFLAGTVPASETSWHSYGQRATGSVVTHAAVLLFIVFVLTRIPESGSPTILNDKLSDITWLKIPGPGRGGGGSGNKTPEPPRKAQIVPPKPRAEPPSTIVDLPKPLPPMNIPAVTAVAELPGEISALPDAPSLGPGTGMRGGTGVGPGSGPGNGSGLGPGSLGGTGTGEYREGNGVTSPSLIKEMKPNYTGAAMHARIQGTVTMEAVVMPDGSVGRVHITRSLDSAFGLDQEAIKTVKQWRFEPGRRLGQPVPVLIIIEMTFTLR